MSEASFKQQDVKRRSTRSGINAQPSSSVKDQLRYPHFSFGQVSGFIGLNIQFHQLTYGQFIAGELETIHSCCDPQEQRGRMELLHRISQWSLRANVAWVQIRNTYAHILRKIENREITWEADWDRFEHFIYDKIVQNTKPKTSASSKPKSEITWFCRMYQKPEGCPKDSPHPGRIGNQYRQLHHICAACWLKDHVKRAHPESSPECLQKEM